MKLENIVRDAEAKIEAAEESRKPKAKARVKWEIERLTTLDNGLPANMLLEIATKFAPSFAATLATGVEAHWSDETVERQLNDIRLQADEEVSRVRQEYFDQKQPGHFIAKVKTQLERFFWRTRERHCIAKIIKPWLPVEIIDIGWHEIKLSNGKTITRRDLLQIDRPVGVNADFETFERTFVSDGAIQREIQRRQFVAADAKRSFVGGTAGPWRHR